MMGDNDRRALSMNMGLLGMQMLDATSSKVRM